MLDASINVMGTLNVLACAAKVETRKVVYAASGGTIYGEPRRLPAKESAAQGSHPLSPYGISKKVVLDYLGFYQRYRGLEYTALALGNVYGPRQDPHGEAGVVAIFASRMLAGEPVTIFGDGNQTRDYVFIDDVVHAFVQAVDRGPGKLVNIGDGARDEREPPLPPARRHRRVTSWSQRSGRCRRGSCGASPSTSARPRTRSRGSRGPTSRTAWPRPSPT